MKFEFFLFLFGKICRLLKIDIVLIDLPYRIGHLAVGPDSFIKNQINNKKRCKSILIIDKEKIVNKSLLKCWSKYFYIINLKKIDTYVRKNEEQLSKYFKIIYVNSNLYSKIESEYNKAPLLKLSSKEIQKGRNILYNLGIKKTDWFVCFHNRESDYIPRFKYHDYRNGDIDTYKKAFEYIVSKGGWVFRMGDPTMKKIKQEKNIIDYANSDIRSEFMDVFLCSQCKFFVGNTSGLSWVAGIFGTPLALVNYLPYSHKPYYKGNLYITKLLRYKDKSNFIPFKTIFDSKISLYNRIENYNKKHIEIIDNSPEEILDIVKEMFIKVNKKEVLIDNSSKLQKQFQELFVDKNDHGYYSKAKIGESFIQQYSNLFKE